eukprot:SAG11_NODE_37640_length_256_cov_0.592357_1_plen_66_part_01
MLCLPDNLVGRVVYSHLSALHASADDATSESENDDTAASDAENLPTGLAGPADLLEEGQLLRCSIV